MKNCKSDISLPKAPIAGSLHLEFKKCGCKSCHCNAGRLHGPYVYRHWREGGRQRKAYVRPEDLVRMFLAIAARQAETTGLQSLRAELRRLATPGADGKAGNAPL